MRKPGRSEELALEAYKRDGGRANLNRALRAIDPFLSGLARRYARFSHTGLHDVDDLRAVGAAEVHYATLAFEYGCGLCARPAPRFLSRAGLLQHGRGTHRRLGLPPSKSLGTFVYWRVGRALQRVLDPERAASRSMLAYDRRAPAPRPGRAAVYLSFPDPLDARVYVDDALDLLEAVAAAEETLPARERELLRGLLREEERPALLAALEAEHGLRPGAGKAAARRLRDRLSGGRLRDLLPAATV